MQKESETNSKEDFTMKSDDKGWTLAELMIVIAIIGILAAIAIPNYMRYLSKTKQAEAKIFLSGIGKWQEVYLIENDIYADSIDNLGFGTKGNTRYTYVVSDTSRTGYTITATSKAPGICGKGEADDVLVINQTLNISNVSKCL